VPPKLYEDLLDGPVDLGPLQRILVLDGRVRGRLPPTAVEHFAHSPNPIGGSCPDVEGDIEQDLNQPVGIATCQFACSGRVHPEVDPSGSRRHPWETA
jgi:hypothetical protein